MPDGQRRGLAAQLVRSIRDECLADDQFPQGDESPRDRQSADRVRPTASCGSTTGRLRRQPRQALTIATSPRSSKWSHIGSTAPKGSPRRSIHIRVMKRCAGSFAPWISVQPCAVRSPVRKAPNGRLASRLLLSRPPEGSESNLGSVRCSWWMANWPKAFRRDRRIWPARCLPVPWLSPIVCPRGLRPSGNGRTQADTL